MNYSFTDRLKHAWNVFKSRDPTDYSRDYRQYYGGDAYRPDYNKPRFGSASDRSIVTAIKNRIAVDSAQVDIQHVRLDDNGRYVETIDSGLNYCLSTDANIDQTGRALRLDMFMSLLDYGVIAIVPVDTTFDPEISGTYQISNMRIGKVTQWYPQMVRVELYNEKTGNREEILVPKKIVAIVENPFYSVMNAPNSTFQRLTHKLALLDAVDEQASAGKLDLIIQLPYVVKTETRKQQANQRRKDIEDQLAGSKYGIAYTDGTERIQQLNRPLENNLLGQIQYLTELAYSQLGITADIMNGTADEKTMLNYNNRIIEPLVAAVADSMKRTFLTKTAITQHQSIEYFRDPFALVPINNIAEIADKFTRNEITTSNEIRQAIGMKPSTDPNADTLRNKNLYDTTGAAPGSGSTYETVAPTAIDGSVPITEQEVSRMTSDLDALDAQLDEVEDILNHSDLKHYDDPLKAKEYRHWYWENYEKEGKTIGRQSSTAGLNEAGRDYARYIRELLNDERKQKVANSKASTDASIETSRKTRDSGIETSKKSRDNLVNSTNEARDRSISSDRDAMNAGIESSKSNRDMKVTSTNEKRDRDIETARTNTRSEIESHTSQMQTKIDVLKNQLSSLSKEEKAAVKERIQQEISDLREANKAKRIELQEALKFETAGIRTEAKTENDNTRNAHKETTTSLRSEFSTKSTETRSKAKASTDKFKEAHTKKASELRESHATTAKGLREQHKTNTVKAKQEYEDQYAKELEYIKSLPEFQAAKKGSSKTTAEKAVRGADGKMYVRKKS